MGWKNKEDKREYERQWRLNNVEKIKNKNRSRYLKNKSNIAIKHKIWRDKNKEKIKGYAANLGKEKRKRYSDKHRYKAEYGLIYEQAKDILSKGCAICGTKEGTLCIDHDHVTGKVRGCLCRAHNAALGLLNDSLVFIDRLKQYLLENK